MKQLEYLMNRCPDIVELAVPDCGRGQQYIYRLRRASGSSCNRDKSSPPAASPYYSRLISLDRPAIARYRSSHGALIRRDDMFLDNRV
jgi:hypothetical protein